MVLLHCYYIYVYNTIRGWVKITSNPIAGYANIEDGMEPMQESATRYPEREFTIMPVLKYINR